MRKLSSLLPALAALATLALLWGPPDVARAATVNVTGGQTSIAFDTAALTTAGLTVSGSTGVNDPGDIPNSLGFPINPRDAAVRPTTFSYDPTDFANTHTGNIEHSGTVQFNGNPALDAGDLTIAFDANRAGTLNGNASGYFVQTNTGGGGILFDLGTPTNLNATDTSLTIDANVLASPEFAQALLGSQTTTTDVTGSVLGTAHIAATASGEQPPPPPPPGIPLPPAVIPGLACLGMLGLGAGLRKTRTA